MIAYGTKINSDIGFPIDLSHTTETRHEVSLCASPPKRILDMITVGIPFYWSHGRQVNVYSDRVFDGNHPGQPWCYEVKGVLRLYWIGGKSTVYYQLDKLGDANLLSFWFVHLFLPLYLTLEEKYDFLHAGAVEVAGKPILFIAPSMGGKSTTTQFFIQQDHGLISDDKVPTFFEDEQFMAVGSHPYHRPYRKFEDLGHRVDNFSEAFKPIHAFYSLKKAKADATVAVEEIVGFKKFDTLLPNFLNTFTYLKPRRLQYHSNMLNHIRVFRIQVPWAMGRLREVHDTICEHSQNIK